MRTFRSERVSSLLRERLGMMIEREVEISGAIITITTVQVSSDLSDATVNVSVFPTDRGPEALKILEKRAGSFQYMLIRDMNIKPLPRITFALDLGNDKAARIEKRLMEENN
ncbi:MAG: hypothetical protein COU07_02325 [Candidatus Harrisonbacteria bacterium CG10_big_fil_rev_8_21_14_0_10_40_38]|uniref:Ribosome-binding factor A n=1 Tax=Candidatus Harrisonbacteria bacterium CG10_big_fil_rev_8_21_14_0_10_40_38 TaxID=1974583 RepID=A0A2H0US58_9BACT|nr:MAG: hypothetical protein COU07_02325 [Candidatus Harrisonbacteria bacterium CG10_big_fil_rev_8_21_14_0_10_40_38]